MSVPESWKILLDKKEELSRRLEGIESMERMLKTQLSKNLKHGESVKLMIDDMTDSLKMLGWIPERIDQ